ncbi:hypothetical protein FRC12_011211 [Ceratobasidium sp. 428]|nr:hypothetical protein FRC12_011211 [Ceratobasidium sp. 428]
MFVKLEHRFSRLKQFLVKPFRGRGRSHDRVQNTNLDPMEWDGLRSLATSFDQTTSIPRFLVTVVKKLSVCIETFDDEARAHGEYDNLRTDLNDLFRELSGYLNETVSSSAGRSRVENLARCLQTVVEPMRLRRGEGETGRDDEIKEGIGEILRGYGRIRVLILQFVLSEKTTWGGSTEVDYDDALNHLPRSAAACYNSSSSHSTGRSACTPNTCVGVLEQLRLWASYNPHQKLYWLNGSPGTGKTTIAYTLCEQLKSAGKLAASFFCARWSPECRDVKTILPSISYQLASFSRPFRYAISNTLDQGVDLRTLSVQDQFERLIATPLRMVGYTFPAGVVVVVDALDECEDADLVDRMLVTLLACASNLPIKFLVTTRLEPYIAYRMQSEQGSDTVLESSLSTLDPSLVRMDINTFMGTELSFAAPSTDDLEYLASLSATSFYKAAMLVRYILRGYQFGSAERTRRLQQLLDSSTSSDDINDEGMDSVYNAILEAALEVDSFEAPERAEPACSVSAPQGWSATC